MLRASAANTHKGSIRQCSQNTKRKVLNTREHYLHETPGESKKEMLDSYEAVEAELTVKTVSYDAFVAISTIMYSSLLE